MPQHKLKVKEKVRKNLKLKKKMKGSPATPRSNKPVAANKRKLTKSQKVKKVITRSIIVMVEEKRSVQSSKTKAASSKGAKAKKGGKK